MSNIQTGQIFTNSEMDLIAGLNALAISSATQAIQKTSASTFANVELNVSGAIWGQITGTLSNQTDLQIALNLKANLASPTFTGTVVLPSTTSIGTVSNTEISYLDGVTSSIQAQLDAIEGSDVDSIIGTANQITASNPTGNVTLSLPTTIIGVDTLVGGTSTTQDLTFKTTTGVGATGADMHFLVGNNGATEAMTILNSGNVGIGTTAPLATFQVGSSSALTNYQGAAAGIMLPSGSGSWLELAENTVNGTSFRISKDSSTGIMFNSNIRDIGFRADAYGTAISGAQLVLKTSGNVGIGQTAPAGLLDIGSSNAVGAVHTQLNGGNSDTVPALSFSSFSGGVPTTWANSDFGFGLFYSSTDGDLDMYRKNSSTTGVHVLTIKRDSGNVGIGTTAPGARLTVNPAVTPTTYGAATQLQLGEVTNTDGYHLNVGYGYLAGVYTGVINVLAASVAAPLSINPSGGNVGIGTTAPFSKFQVGAPTGAYTVTNSLVANLYGAYSTTRGTLNLASTDAAAVDKGGTLTFSGENTVDSGGVGATSPYFFARIKGAKEGAADTYNGYLSFETTATNSANTERMRIDSAGNVGIGTTAPGAKLEISDATTATLRLTGANVTSQIDGYSAGNQVITRIQTDREGSNTSGKLSFWTASSIDSVLTSQMTINALGDVGIGITVPLAKLEISSAIGSTPVNGTVNALTLTSSTTAGVGVGPYLKFKGETGNATSSYGFAAIQGAKESVTAGDYGGYLSFHTQAADGASAIAEKMRITSTGNVGIGVTSPTAVLHLKAGTATANTAPLQFNTGTIETTARAGLVEYNGNHRITNVALLRMPVGGTLFNNFTDTSTTSTDGTENDLYTYTTLANTFNTDGDSVYEKEHAQFVASATATRRLKKYFAGTLIFDSGALTLSLGGDFWLETTVIRESSTVVRVSVAVVTTSASSIPYSTYTRITGLTLSGTNILKTTGIAAGVGAASGDIINKLSKVSFEPAA